MATQQEKAQALRALHRPGEPLVLINVWDAVTARIIEELGYPAIATTSAGVAFAEGYADGERISREAMLAGIARVTRVVQVPVTADMEAGYGFSPEDAAATARGVIAAGAVGLNFEDGHDERELMDLERQVQRIQAMREAANAAGVPLCINARTDAFLAGIGENDDWRLKESIRRGNRFLQAGADSVFVPGVADETLIGKLCAAIDGPVNILAGGASPSLPRLAELGVARISVGSASIGYAMAQFRSAAQDVKDSGSFSFAKERISHGEMIALFSERASH